ncbi:MAG: hypothetical protein U9Q82_04320 [Chloroflexota bacterium]|nr:hypothetical protein [Chloroflexota bacterium]
MRTPAGNECPYFYGDYYRGREHEECRLLPADQARKWTPQLCATCPVPGITQANSCENMILHASIYKPFFIFKARVQIQAYCTKTQRDVPEPHIGCGECHPLPPVFAREANDADTTD